MQDWNVLQCNPGVYCCRHSKDLASCCDQEDRFLIFDSPGKLLLSTATPSRPAEFNTPSPASPSSETVTVTATARPMHREQPDSSLDSGKIPVLTEGRCQPDKSAIVGGAVGGVLGTALLSALGVIAFLLIRQAKRQPPAYQFQTVGSLGEFRIVQQPCKSSNLLAPMKNQLTIPSPWIKSKLNTNNT